MEDRRGQDVDSSSVLTEAGETLRRYYALHRARSGGPSVYFATLRDRNSHRLARWNPAAEYAMSRGVNMRTYIDWCFNRFLPSYPQVNMVTSRTSIDQYVTNKMPDIEGTSMRRLWSLMVKRLQREMEAGVSMEDALLDPRNEMNPVFVAVTLKAAGKDPRKTMPADMFAKAEFAVWAQPVYMELLGDHIPEEVRQYAAV